jgi:hypothetical protein
MRYVTDGQIRQYVRNPFIGHIVCNLDLQASTPLLHDTQYLVFVASSNWIFR